MSDDGDFRIKARVVRIEGDDRQVIKTYSSKQKALRYANEMLVKERQVLGVNSHIRYIVEMQYPELHLMLTDRAKKLIYLSHKMVKQLVAAWIEATHNISRTYYEKSIDGRKLDVVLENVVEEKPFRVFVEVESQPVGEQYVQEFLKYCAKSNPSKALIVSPVFRQETRFWTDRTRKKKCSLEIIPTKEVFKKVKEEYTLKFDTLGGDVVLVLDPFKEIVMKHKDAPNESSKQDSEKS